MAGYSGTPLARKLGITPGARLAVLGAPAGFAIPDLPPGVEARSTARGTFDVIVSFHESRAALAARLPVLMRALHVDGGLWIAWPKRASGVPTDVTEDAVREVALPTGLVDVKVCAIRRHLVRPAALPPQGAALGPHHSRQLTAPSRECAITTPGRTSDPAGTTAAG